jgi:hypothetical protein
MPPIRAQNDLRRAADLGDFLASAFFTGGFNPGFPGLALLYDARPLAFKPPLGFLPADRCHAGDLAISTKTFAASPYTFHPVDAAYPDQ